VSIYRKFDAMRLPSSDVYARTGAPEKRPVGSAGSPQAANHELRRKGAPANVPLPRTLRWVEALPSSVKPTALLRHYARIANVLAAAWDDPIAVSSYMDCLFRDEREYRRGFPPDVANELLTLREYHANLNTVHTSNWAVLHKRGS
jgi:hypothetical protein